MLSSLLNAERRKHPVRGVCYSELLTHVPTDDSTVKTLVMSDFSKHDRELRELDEAARLEPLEGGEKRTAVESNRAAVPRWMVSLLFALGILGPIGAVALTVQNHFAIHRAVRRAQDMEDRRFLISALRQIRERRTTETTAEVWNQLRDQLLLEAQTHATSLERRLVPEQLQRQVLLQALQNHLPQALESGQSESRLAEQAVEDAIHEAGRLMNLKYENPMKSFGNPPREPSRP
jgi:hypothetical protein